VERKPPRWGVKIDFTVFSAISIALFVKDIYIYSTLAALSYEIKQERR
jgi:hypothetical protein